LTVFQWASIHNICGINTYKACR